MKSRTRLVLISLAIAIVGAAGVWWFIIRSDAPPPVSLEEAVSAATSSTAPGNPEPTDATRGRVDIDGTWSVVVGNGSFAGYRVEEELARIGFTEAAGRTESMRASLEIEDGTVVSVQVQVDMQSLRSDSDRRDGAIKSQALETDAFPTASFELTGAVALPDSAANGEPFTIAATGDLTVHGVTRSIVLDLEAQLVGDTIAVIGSTEILFEDYSIDQPRSLVLLSVDNHGLMEFQLLFERN